MNHSADDVADMVLYVCRKDGLEMTNLRLQYILCLLMMDWRRRTGRRLFPDAIEIWFHGPVVPHIYNRYRMYGAEPITGPAESRIRGRDARLLKKMVRRYYDKTLGQLVRSLNEAGYPRWDGSVRTLYS